MAQTKNIPTFLHKLDGLGKVQTTKEMSEMCEATKEREIERDAKRESYAHFCVKDKGGVFSIRDDGLSVASNWKHLVESPNHIP